MDKSRYQSFLKAYAANQHTKEEHAHFLKWYYSLSDTDARDVMEEYARLSSDGSHFLPFDKQKILNKIETELDALEGKANLEQAAQDSGWSRFWPYMSAAMLLIIVGLGYFFTDNLSPFQQEVAQVSKSPDIAPGGNRAVLTLGDGSTIVLNNAKSGEIARQHGVQISKIADGQLVYEAGNAKEIKVPRNFNEIRTPKAGQYRVELADGTKVWLNSASSIRFPASFGTELRKVQITGEVYFEVASVYRAGRKVPFHVYSKGQKIEVLGTHFNVQSYDDEGEIKTTLLEGSVRVTTLKSDKKIRADSVLLRPGEQAIYRTQLGPISVQKVDAETAVAWKTGYFKFKDTEIKEVMRQLARWYDLDVAYVGTLPQDQFTGYISKNVAISQVLNILEEGGGVRFSLQGKQVEVFNRN